MKQAGDFWQAGGESRKDEGGWQNTVLTPDFRQILSQQTVQRINDLLLSSCAHNSSSLDSKLKHTRVKQLLQFRVLLSNRFM